MSALLTVLLMSILLGAGSFAIGMLPLMFTFSRTRLVHLSTFGTGLLLGAALGVIIPEGIETLISSSHQSEPAPKIALSLLVGFTFMLLVEQFISGHSHSSSAHAHFEPISLSPTTPVSHGEDNVVFDMALDELEMEQGTHTGTSESSQDHGPEDRASTNKAKAYPLTLGLVIHSLADGLALGASALPRSSSTSESAAPQLSLIVFLALIIHKAPTALALSMSLLSTLPRAECRKHLAFFSASTPLGALLSFAVLSFFGGAGAGDEGEWTGIALLVSGGTFLYVATVLQPGSDHSSQNNKDKLRVFIVILGMFTPFLIGTLIGHEHAHGIADSPAVGVPS